jgi:heat shock protein HslJ
MSTTTAPPPSFSPVQGAFAASFYEDSSGEHRAVSGTSLVVEFSVLGGRNLIGWTGGCNSLGTTYTISDGHLHLDKNIGTTAVLCGQARTDRDNLLSRVLGGNPAGSISATSLRIDDSHTTMTLEPTTKNAYDPQ